MKANPYALVLWTAVSYGPLTFQLCWIETNHKNVGMNGSRIGILLLILYNAFAAGQTPTRYDVIIDEIFADPSPSVGLPGYEFIELKNVSSTAINLKDWALSDGNSTATISTNFLILPDSFVVICTNSAVNLFREYGSAIGVNNFPSLEND